MIKSKRFLKKWHLNNYKGVITMNVICSWNVANGFIEKSYEDGIYITPQKLNYLIYLLYSDYLF